jgi:hypothetical protein
MTVTSAPHYDLEDADKPTSRWTIHPDNWQIMKVQAQVRSELQTRLDGNASQLGLDI